MHFYIVRMNRPQGRSPPRSTRELRTWSWESVARETARAVSPSRASNRVEPRAVRPLLGPSSKRVGAGERPLSLGRYLTRQVLPSSPGLTSSKPFLTRGFKLRLSVDLSIAIVPASSPTDVSPIKRLVTSRVNWVALQTARRQNPGLFAMAASLPAPPCAGRYRAHALGLPLQASSMLLPRCLIYVHIPY